MIFIGDRNAWKSAFEDFLRKVGFQIFTEKSS
jgi:hypothetical protein